MNQLKLFGEECNNTFTEVMNQIEQESENYWNNLTKEEQLKVFCAVVRRIYQAEVVDKGSYRHALYSVFNFGPESYAPAQMSGYLTLHNLIFAVDHDFKLLEAFCLKNNIHKSKVVEFLS